MAAGQLVGRACHLGGLLLIAVLINLVTRRRPTSQPGNKRLVRTGASAAPDQLNRIAYEDDHYAGTTMTVREREGCHRPRQQTPLS